MPDTRLEAVGLSLPHRFFKLANLLVAVGQVHNLRRGKMTEDAFADHLRSRADGFEDSRQVFRVGAQAVHPGIDLEMNSRAALGLQLDCFGSSLQQLDVAWLPDCRSQLVPDDVFFLARPKSA